MPQLREDNARTRYLTPKEVKGLLKHCVEPLRSVAQVALFTGARRGEVLGLRWSAVDFEAGLLTFTRTKSGKVKHVPMAEPLREVLTAVPRRLGCDHVFWVEREVDGKIVAEQIRWPRLRRRWDSALEKAGLQPKEGEEDTEAVTFHTLRHTAASFMIMAGVDLYKVQAILGHSTPTVTQRYAHLCPDDLRPAVEKLAAACQDSVRESEAEGG